MTETSFQDELDLRLMRRALALAAESEGLASPNPQVGAVLVTPGPEPKVLGEGAHLYDRRDHAEIAALRQAAEMGNEVRGATAYVTLEPCSHHGRTGPCADALLAAGIGRCVVATADPNPLVGGQGLARLRAAGVEVTTGPEQAEARAMNLAFAGSMRYGRPLVTLKAALSADGYLAPPPQQRGAQAEPFWLTGPPARAEVQRLRHGSDAVLTGVGTVLADDPWLTDRSGLPRRRPLLRVVLDGQLRTPVESHLVRSAGAAGAPDLLLLCGEEAPAEREAMLRAACPALLIRRLPPGSGGRPSLQAAMEVLAEMRCLSVLAEGGAMLNAALLREELVDRVVLFFAERELGSGSVPFAQGGISPFALQQQLLQRADVQVGRDAMISGLLHDPWDGVR